MLGRTLIQILYLTFLFSRSALADAPFKEVEDYVLEFYYDFLVNEQSYYNKYYTFLATHIFDVNPSYSKDINQILEGGEDVSAALQANPALATNLYYMATEFPWYSQFSATATAPNPTVAPYKAVAGATSVAPVSTSAVGSSTTSSATTAAPAPTSSTAKAISATPPAISSPQSALALTSSEAGPCIWSSSSNNPSLTVAAKFNGTQGPVPVTTTMLAITVLAMLCCVSMWQSDNLYILSIIR